jgi:hypothetical protein
LARVIRLGYGVLWHVLSVRAAIPPGDGPVLGVAACAVPAGIEVAAAPARSPAFFSPARQIQRKPSFAFDP